MSNLWHRLLVRLGLRKEYPQLPMSDFMRAALRNHTADLARRVENGNLVLRSLKKRP